MPLCSSCGGNTFVPRVVVDPFGLHNRLRTESGPASVQPDEVASVLQNIERDLEGYEAEIFRLGQEKERFECYATQLHSLNSSFRKVPNEILRHIFDDCCDMNSFRVVDLERRLPMSSQALRSKPAMVISSVCSRWRRNALSMPALWSRISLYWDMDAPYRKEEHTKILFPLSNFLDRSQQYPMTVSFDLSNYSLDDEIFHPLLKQFFSQIIRWRDVSFEGSLSFSYLLLCCGITSASFPVLHKLQVNNHVEQDLAPFVDTSPNLQALSLGYADAGCLTEIFKISQLSHLGSVVDSNNVFNKCPNLFSLHLVEDSPSNAAPILLGKLEIVTIMHGFWDISHDHDYKSVYPLLRVPSLKAFHLKKADLTGLIEEVEGESGLEADGPWGYVEDFMVFVQQSSFQLTTFSIHHLSISDANLFDILVLLPTLQYLTVDDDGISTEHSPISSEFIDSLHAYRISSLRPQEACIVPRLRSLRLLNVAATTFRDLSVVKMVQSRWSPAKLHAVGTTTFEVDCLRVFTMTFPNRLKMEAGGSYSSLDLIERGGMMIVIQMSGVTLRD